MLQIEFDNLLPYDKYFFSAFVRGRFIIGRVSVKNAKVFLAQDIINREPGKFSPYSGAVCVGAGRPQDIQAQEITNFILYSFQGNRTIYNSIKSLCMSSVLFNYLKPMTVRVKGEEVNVSIDVQFSVANAGNVIVILSIPVADKVPNCFDFDENGNISYYSGLQSMSTEEDDDGNEYLVWEPYGRQEMRPSKFIRLFLPFMKTDARDADLHAVAINRYCECVAEQLAPKNGQIQISDDILRIYHTATAPSNTGSLGGSCMRPESSGYGGKQYLGTYNKLNGVKIAYLKTDNDFLLGRALLWHDLYFVSNPDKKFNFMDRIYGSDKTIAQFQQWAAKNGYYCKENQSAGATTIISPEGKSYREPFASNQSGYIWDKLKGFPYMDTISKLTPNEIIFTSDIPRQENFKFLELQSTNCPLDGVCHNCCSRGAQVLMAIDTGKRLCSSCAVVFKSPYSNIKSGAYEYYQEIIFNGSLQKVPQVVIDNAASLGLIFIPNSGLWKESEVFYCQKCGQLEIKYHAMNENKKLCRCCYIKERMKK